MEQSKIVKINENEYHQRPNDIQKFLVVSKNIKIETNECEPL